VSAVVGLGLLVSGAYAWEYTNSPEFCGMRCHSMPPEYSSYQQSPHARVKCVECHIGREFVGNQFTRKLGDLRHVIAQVSNDYEFPIEVKSMRPARETCERCHFPEKFSDDSQRTKVHYQPDEQNTLHRTYLLLKTGGGTVREGLGRGIHWHIENKVLFYATDDGEQEIPYVRVLGGEERPTIEYVDVASDFDTYAIDESQLKEMDCITCHNRISHAIPQPEEAVDQALYRRLISPDIPQIRLKAVEVLRASYETTERALNAIAGLTNYYQENHPEYVAAHPETISQAVNVLKEIYEQSVYPEQKVDWDTHPDNMGHQADPGCFRCHDGKHLDSAANAIRLECNLCHAIPVISGPEEQITHIDINHEPRPGTHQNPNWIALHEVVFDENDEDEICSMTTQPSAPTLPVMIASSTTLIFRYWRVPRSASCCWPSCLIIRLLCRPFPSGM
jgi:nitrate/TMAO reductase-like tetraheme cytochrome c subunit